MNQSPTSVPRKDAFFGFHTDLHAHKEDTVLGADIDVRNVLRIDAKLKSVEWTYGGKSKEMRYEAGMLHVALGQTLDTRRAVYCIRNNDLENQAHMGMIGIIISRQI